VKEHGLGAAQIYVLNELQESAPLSVSELAARTGTDQSTVSVVVAILVAKGLITNRRAEDDARRIELVLTAKGIKSLRNLPPPVQQQIVAAVDQLPAARARVLADSLQEIVERMGIASDRPPLMFDDAHTPKTTKRTKTTAKKKS
jgi:DNA-binding MarR family transcriptional regulator